tara:strand:+ start:1506 stop:1943 length:438 start_codon:yes stop_codon:yes gene_type:complete
LILSLLVGVALGVPPLPERPAPPDRVPGECNTNYPISLGRSLPDGLATPSVLANCSAVAVPLSEYADLLGTEHWAIAIEKRYKLDTLVLKNERDWYKNRLEEEMSPKSFVERPGTQRWFGRIETLITVGLVATTMGVTYKYTLGE